MRDPGLLRWEITWELGNAMLVGHVVIVPWSQCCVRVCGKSTCITDTCSFGRYFARSQSADPSDDLACFVSEDGATRNRPPASKASRSVDGMQEYSCIAVCTGNCPSKVRWWKLASSRTGHEDISEHAQRLHSPL